MPGSFGQQEDPRDQDARVAPDEFVSVPRENEEQQREVLPAKTSKKDKKGKKRSGALDDLETSIPKPENGIAMKAPAAISVDLEPAAQTPRDLVIPAVMPEGETGAGPDAVAEAERIMLGAQGPVSGGDAAREGLEPQLRIDERAEAGNEPVADEWAVPVKKSKKDKKSKRKSVAYDDFKSESPATGSLMPATEKGRDVQEKAPATEEPEQLPLADEPKLVEEPAEDEWAVLSKKSKKDKKSKRKSVAYDDIESESPATGSQTPGIEYSRDVQEKAPVAEEPEQLLLRDEPKLVEEPAEDEWAVPIKKSKKDKKSKKKPALVDDFDSDSPATSSQTPAVEESRDAQRTVSVTEELKQPPSADEPEQIISGDQPKATEDPIEDEWAVPSKKSKKDKRSKRKTLDLDFAEPTGTSTLTTESREIESSTPFAVSSASLAAGALAGLAGVGILSADREKGVEDEEVALATGKKGKKEKKKGRVFSLADDGEETSVTDAPEPEVVENPSAEPEEASALEDEWAVPTKKSKKSKKKGNLALVEEDPPVEERERSSRGNLVDQPSNTVDERGSVVPTLTLVDDVTGHYFGMLRDYQPAAVVPTAIHVNNVTGHYFGLLKDYQPAAVAPTAAHVDDVTSHYFGILRNYEPAPSAPDNKSTQPSREVAQNVSTSTDEVPELDETEIKHSAALSRSSEVINRDASELSSSKPAHDFPVVPVVAHVDDVIGFHYEMLRDYKPSATRVQQSKKIAEQVDPAASMTAPIDLAPDDWAVPVKKSKKDKKKKRQSVFDDEQLDAESMLPEASQNDVREDALVEVEPKDLTAPNAAPLEPPTEIDPMPATALTEPSAANEDLYPAPSKKSKKDKKKKRQLTFDDQEETSTGQSKDVSNGDAHLPIIAGVGVAALSTGILASSRDADAGADEGTTPKAPAVDEDFAPSNSKKSKKDKKKKRQSAFDDFDEGQTTSPAQDESRDVKPDDVVPPASIADHIVSSKRPEAAVETPLETEERAYEFSTKKSKKDKKAKRQSTFEVFDDEKPSSTGLEESRVVTSDNVAPLADSIDVAEPSETARAIAEIPAEFEEQSFEPSTKKSKKDNKKKRRSTFDDFDTATTTSADDVGASATAKMETTSESPMVIDETVSLADDEAFVEPSKKSKKNQKQRQSMLDNVEMEEPAALVTQEPPLHDSSVAAKTTSETRELEDSPSTNQEPVLGDDGWPIDAAASQVTPAEEEEWAVPAKKSMNDKKKKKTLLSWEDGEDSPSQPTGTSTPAESTHARDVRIQETLHRSEQEPAIVPDSMSAVAAQPDDEEDRAMRHQRRKSKSVPGGWGEEEEEPIVDEPMLNEPAQVLDEPSKLVDEPMRDAEEPKTRDISHSQQEIEPKPEEKEMGYVVKKSKKDKQGKKSRKSEVYSKDPESREVEESQAAAAPEPFEQAQVYDKIIEEVAPADEWGFASKKSKKDKKSKKGKNVLEEEVAAPEILAIPDFSQEYSGRDVGGDDEWAVPTKKSKKDKKSKRVSTRDMAEDAQSAEPLAYPVNNHDHVDVIAGHYHGMLRSYRPAEGVPDNKSLVASRNTMRESEIPHIDDVTGHYHGLLRQYLPAEGTPDNKSTASPRRITNEPDISHVDDVTGHYYGMLRDYQPPAAAPHKRSPATSREIATKPGTPHIDEVTGHYYGMLQDYQPVQGAQDYKSVSALHDLEYAQRAERVPSPSSDEETRRARRARRKASPVYRGEEPEDFPGDRSLTPPAKHDDMMTTALGVAAGLGLTGAAAQAASTRPSITDARNLENTQAAAPTTQPPGWSFAKMNAPGDVHQVQRDSGVQFADSPTLPHEQFDPSNRDSGYVKSPANRQSWPEESSGNAGRLHVSNRPPRPQSPTSSSEDVSGKRSKRVSRDMEETLNRREPSPVLSTSKDRSSKLFTSPLSSRVKDLGETSRLDTAHLSGQATDIHRSRSIHGHPEDREEHRPRSPASSEPRHMVETHHEQSIAPEPHRSIFGPYPTQEGQERGFSPPKTPLHTISEHSQDTSPSLHRQRDTSDIGESHNQKSMQHQESGRNLRDIAGIAGGAAIGALATHELSRDDQPATRAKTLGTSKANTKSSRSLRRATFDPDVVPSSGIYDPSEGKTKEVARGMSDVYDGQGEYPGSPMSPTRPPSMRKRQSMQQIRDLETRLDQLAAENRNLAEAKIIAERHLEDTQLERHKSGYAGQEAVESANAQLREKDDAIARLQQELEGMRQDHARLSEVNAGLSDAHDTQRMQHEQRYSELEDLHAETHDNWQESSRELETLRGQHTELSGDMEDTVRHEISTVLAEKNVEIERLRSDLQTAKEKIKELEQQILSGGGDDILNFRDEDYFESACQSLCQHVQQWVLRFSKFSDTLVCRTTQQIRDEKLVDRFDLAILDGSDVDMYLGDRIKRRDVFMSVVMTMIFEYIFTRYLFGMDRDQRQTLKKLEKNLSEVGERGAVHQWRAMTLTLLAKREACRASREDDTEAVVLQVYDTLAKFLPPPQNLQAQVQESLRTVMRTAVDLSIEMRTQKAEYIMLPPLQPEYDTNGDLTRKVYFNASLMNERSGETSSNDELEAQQAVVRMVLFPLVVKKGNDDGEGEEEIVVCPAQVLVARPDRKSKANSGRVVSAQSDRMSVDQMSRANASKHSLAPSTMDMSNVI